MRKSDSQVGRWRAPVSWIFSAIVARAYSHGYATYGDLELRLATFQNALMRVIDKHVGPNAFPADRLSFLRTLHTDDLYLALACANPTESAWRCFAAAYQKWIRMFARQVSPTSDAAHELAGNVLGDLFMPGRSGRRRIESFDGQQSLSVWLRVIVTRRAINARQTKWNSFEPLDSACDVADYTWPARIEGRIRTNRYNEVIKDSFEIAVASLTQQERFTILLRYDEGYRVAEIGTYFGVYPSSITRQIQRIQFKLQKKIISALSGKHHLGPAAIKECMVEIMENSEHSILPLLKAYPACAERMIERRRLGKTGAL